MNQNVSQNQMVNDCMVEMARDLLDADLVSQFGGHDKSIIVESEFEVILTHLPLWKNESPLFMIGRMLDNHMMKSLVKQEDVIETIKSFWSLNHLFRIVRSCNTPDSSSNPVGRNDGLNRITKSYKYRIILDVKKTF